MILLDALDSIAPTPESNEVLIALIGAVGTVMVALTGIAVALIGRAGAHAKVAAVASKAAAVDSALAKEQVVNAHTTNLREESDERHTEIVDLFAAADRRIDAVATTQKEQGRRIDVMASDQQGVRKDVGRVSDMVVESLTRQGNITERLHNLELARRA